MNTSLNPSQLQPAALLESLERFPFRSPEAAEYRNDAPPRGRDNPVYEAVPTPWEEADVWGFITAGKRTYDPVVRELPNRLRRERVDDVLSAMFPLARHLKLEELLSTTIRNSYVGRNPAESLYMERAVAACGGKAVASGTGVVGAGSIFGPPGTGKSESIKQLLVHCCPQVILHSNYRGQLLGIQQLAWLYISCPPKASVSGLIEWIAASLDHIFATDALVEVVRAKSDSIRARIIARRLALHVTGLVVIDEIQNISSSSQKDRAIFSNFLQELINTTRTRFIFVGTQEGMHALCGEALRRRLMGERGTLIWGPLEYEAEWPGFIKNLWQWQATRQATPLTDELSHCMFQLTAGIPSRATLLWTKAQSEVIGNPHHPKELITPAVLTYTMKEYFSEVYRLVQKEIRRTELLKKIQTQSPPVPPDQMNARPVPAPTISPPPPLPAGSATSGFNLEEIVR